MSSFEFNFNASEIKSMANLFNAIAVPSFRKSLLQEMAQVSLELVEQEFIEGRDPYGKRWVPTKNPRGAAHYRILYKTGALAHRIRIKYSETSFELISLVDYFIFHQRGSPRAHIPQRLIFPDELIGLPERWKHAYDEVASSLWRNILVRAAFG